MPRVTEEHRDARRRQILDAARRCFVRDGFHATSMQDVLAEAGLSAGAVYLYFKSKDDLIAAIAAHSLAFITGAFETLLAAADPPPLDEALARMLDVIVTFAREENVLPIAVQVWGEALRSPRLMGLVRTAEGRIRSLLASLVEQYQARGQINPEAQPGQVARALTSFLLGFMLQLAVLGDIDVPTVRSGLRAILAPDLGSPAASHDLTGEAAPL